MADRSRDWLAQAHHDLAQARTSREAGHHDWACFASHQASEMAAEALHFSLGQEVRGHAVRRLLAELPPEVGVPAELLEKARVLDAYYVPTRYANGHSEGAPFEHYGDLQSEEAIRHAVEIVEFCGHAMAVRGRG